MDYKELHNETLQNLQKMVSEGKITEDTAKSICADFVAEIDDEKIRKEIIEYFKKYQALSLGDYNVQDILSWLEKQGEQKPKWSEGEKRKLDRIYFILGIAADEHAYSSTCRLIGDKEAIELQDFLRSIAKPEPKPEEWSEEDLEMIDRLIRHCEKEHEELCNDKYGHQEIVSDLKRSCRERWDWLNRLKSKVGPQPHWEPSEEMLEALSRVIPEDVFEISEDHMHLNELYQGLKYGRVLSKK